MCRIIRTARCVGARMLFGMMPRLCVLYQTKVPLLPSMGTQNPTLIHRAKDGEHRDVHLLTCVALDGYGFMTSVLALQYITPSPDEPLPCEGDWGCLSCGPRRQSGNQLRISYLLWSPFGTGRHPLSISGQLHSMVHLAESAFNAVCNCRVA